MSSALAPNLDALADVGKRFSLAEQIREIEAAQARVNFYEFVKQAWKIHQGSKEFYECYHTQVICDHLQAVAEQKIKRLIICMPPGHGKSWLIVYFKAWLLARDPTLTLISASHSPNVVVRDNLRAKEVVKSPWFQRYICHGRCGPSLRIKREVDGKQRWATHQHGDVIALSTRAGITGERGEGFFVDDPHDAAKAAPGSHNITEPIVWWDEAAENRINWGDPRAFAVVIMQRLLDGDMVSHLLETRKLWHPTENPDGWNYLCLPCVATGESTSVTALGFVDKRKEGEILAPQIMSPERVKQEKENPYKWAAQYQQDPEPARGAIFFRDWEQHWVPGSLPDFDRLTISVDTAGGLKRSRSDDYTVIQLWGMVGAEHYLLDQIRKRMPIHDTVEAIFDMAIRAQSLYGLTVSATLVEKADIGAKVVKQLRSRLAGVRNVKKPGKNEGKTVRANEVVEVWCAEQVWLPPANHKHFAWLGEYLREQRSFPRVAHDDQVDAMTQYLRWAMGIISRDGSKVIRRPEQRQPIYQSQSIQQQDRSFTRPY